MAQIICKNVSLAYENNIVVENLSFKVNQGDYLCIVGENGSGKSSLVKAILSLKNVYKGEITFDEGVKSNEIGYLSQQNNMQKDFPASVNEVVLSGCLNKRGLLPFYSKADKQKAKEKIQELNISDISHRSFMQLSGGQAQRVLLARALCATSKILLLDEPAAGLDPLVTHELYSIIKKINDSSITVIMVSHDINCAVKYASHILHLHHTPLFFGKTSDYINTEIGKRFLRGCVHD